MIKLQKISNGAVSDFEFRFYAFRFVSDFDIWISGFADISPGIWDKSEGLFQSDRERVDYGVFGGLTCATPESLLTATSISAGCRLISSHRAPPQR
jgi:hypothetical protein